MVGTQRAASENDKQSGRCTQGEKVGDSVLLERKGDCFSLMSEGE